MSTSFATLNEYARVLQAPLDIANSELTFCVQVRSVDVNPHENRNIVWRIEQGEDAGDLNCGVAGERKLSLVSFGSKRNQRKLLRLKNVVVHVSVTALIAAVTANRPDNHQARNGLGRGIEFNQSALPVEHSMYVAPAAAQ